MKKMKLNKNPKLFEYDDLNNIVDVFVYEDTRCPYPFTGFNLKKEKWYHQGFYLNEFVVFINDFFEKYKLDYKIKKREKN